MRIRLLDEDKREIAILEVKDTEQANRYIYNGMGAFYEEIKE